MRRASRVVARQGETAAAQLVAATITTRRNDTLAARARRAHGAGMAGWGWGWVCCAVPHCTVPYRVRERRLWTGVDRHRLRLRLRLTQADWQLARALSGWAAAASVQEGLFCGWFSCSRCFADPDGGSSTALPLPADRCGEPFHFSHACPHRSFPRRLIGRVASDTPACLRPSTRARKPAVSAVGASHIASPTRSDMQLEQQPSQAI